MNALLTREQAIALIGIDDSEYSAVAADYGHMGMTPGEMASIASLRRIMGPDNYLDRYYRKVRKPVCNSGALENGGS